jgi:hypothetical protein
MDATAFEVWVGGISGLTEAQRRQVLEMLAVPALEAVAKPVEVLSSEAGAVDRWLIRWVLPALRSLGSGELPVWVARIAAIATLFAGAGRANCLANAVKPASGRSTR